MKKVINQATRILWHPLDEPIKVSGHNATLRESDFINTRDFGIKHGWKDFGASLFFTIDEDTLLLTTFLRSHAQAIADGIESFKEPHSLLAVWFNSGSLSSELGFKHFPGVRLIEYGEVPIYENKTMLVKWEWCK